MPVLAQKGFDSEISPHFGSAPYFAIYDSEKESIVFIENDDSVHEHGMCQPTKMLEDKKINAVVCGGMGGRALQKLNALGIEVYRTDVNSVKGIITALKKKTLDKMSMENACSHHNCH
jgi:predicted Fe-Mo cluster-binding NifX family protein